MNNGHIKIGIFLPAWPDWLIIFLILAFAFNSKIIYFHLLFSFYLILIFHFSPIYFQVHVLLIFICNVIHNGMFCFPLKKVKFIICFIWLSALFVLAPKRKEVKLWLFIAGIKTNRCHRHWLTMSMNFPCRNRIKF